MNNKKKSSNRSPAPKRNEPFIQKRTGLILMILVSIALAAYMFWQLLPALGPLESAAWALGAGIAIWAVFGFMYLFNLKVRGRD